jgi:MFS family permease
VATYVLSYMTTYAITTLHLSATVSTALGLTNSAAQIAGLAVGVWLDRHGRKRMLVLSRVAFLLVVYPVYLILTSPTASVATIVAGNSFLGFVFGIGIGPVYAFMAEAFPQSVRSSGLAILYALGVMIFGGTTQFVVAWLIEVTGDPMVPAWYQMVATTASIVGVLLMTPHAEVLRERRAAEAPA